MSGDGGKTRPELAISSSELIALHVATLFTQDAAGWQVAVNGLAEAASLIEAFDLAVRFRRAQYQLVQRLEEA